MKLLLTIVLNIFFCLASMSQTVRGRVVNELTGEPLVYVNIGIFGTNIGTTSDEVGYFKLNTQGQSLDATVNFTMIGFKSQTFFLKDLQANDNLIKLTEDTIYLKEITVNSTKTDSETIGTKTSSNRIVTGWGTFGTGGERGLKIKVGKSPILIKNLNFYISKNSFDSVLLRLHIRNFSKNLPCEELLKDNILITVTKNSGWVEVDLSKYSLSYKDDIALTLEWVRAWGRCKGSECLLFSLSLTKGTLYAKEASEGKWVVKNSKSPGIYLTVEN